MKSDKRIEETNTQAISFGADNALRRKGDSRMCLSNVYKNDASADNLLYRNIADVRIDGTKIILTDLMGIRSEIEGSIEKVDLMENYIIVRDI